VGEDTVLSGVAIVVLVVVVATVLLSFSIVFSLVQASATDETSGGRPANG